MAKMQREKGARGERELFALLSEQLGVVVQRNLVQTRDSGCDSLSIPGFSIEVKRHETPFRNAWWEQAEATRLQNGGVIPLLFYRQSRRPWTAVFDLSDFYPSVDHGSLCHTDLFTICQLIREELPHVRQQEKIA